MISDDGDDDRSNKKNSKGNKMVESKVKFADPDGVLDPENQTSSPCNPTGPAACKAAVSRIFNPLGATGLQN